LFVCVAHGFPPEDRKISTSCADGESGILRVLRRAGWSLRLRLAGEPSPSDAECLR
jgi:hypothetical protein